MARKLLIVESPAKARTIGKFLGRQFTVKASVGHVRDLPKNKLGVDEQAGFEPHYEVLPSKEKVVDELRRAARNADSIFVATDPDREGEAICWHIAEILGGLDVPFHRVEFNEITRQAVRAGIAHPRRIDENRVDAQQARRVIDRLVGYRLSPLLWKKVKRGLSAGRVQSVALKMICDREAEIDAFTPEEYWLVDALVNAGTPPPFPLRLTKRSGKKWRPGSRATAEEVRGALQKAELVVDDLSSRERRTRPKPPFVTSHMQQAASARLRFPIRKTMRVAQSLYEGVDLGDGGRVGLITYMRTDSFRVAAQAVEEARTLIAERWGDEALPDSPNRYRSRSGAQEAHEAIRPTDVTRTPESLRQALSPDQLRLYQLIWERFVASQMAPARFNVTKVTMNVRPYTFNATGKMLLDQGYQRVWSESSKRDANEVDLPQGLEKGGRLELERVSLEQKWTQPPARYGEATLVKALEENGIGRPSTYASILGTLSDRDYVDREKGSFRPTELGRQVSRLLVGSFGDLIDESYTARLETDLDRVATGDEPWQRTVARFAEQFYPELERASEEMPSLKGGIPTDERCPECGRELVLKFGRYGEFFACSGYPECRHTRDVRDQAEDAGSREGEQETPTCPECGAPMVQKRSRYGPFWACSRYPDCRGKRSMAGKSATRARPTGVPCPETDCDGELVQRRSRRGRVFYGCSRFPECRFSMWNEPLAHPCPQCGCPVMGLKQTKRRGRELVCPRKECGFSMPAEESPESS